MRYSNRHGNTLGKNWTHLQNDMWFICKQNVHEYKVPIAIIEFNWFSDQVFCVYVCGVVINGLRMILSACGQSVMWILVVYSHVIRVASVSLACHWEIVTKTHAYRRNEMKSNRNFHLKATGFDWIVLSTISPFTILYQTFNFPTGLYYIVSSKLGIFFSLTNSMRWNKSHKITPTK